MSMNGQFRQVSPRALSILLEQPDLLPAALEQDQWGADPADPADPMACLPAAMRGIIGTLPPEALQAAVAQQAEMMQRMLGANPALARLLAAEAEDAGEDADALRAAGITDADLPEMLGIDKTWHGLHFLLAGPGYVAGPGAGQAVLGGRETGDEYVYGPVRVMTPAETAEVAAALAALTEDEVAGRYDAGAMAAADLYGAWDDAEELQEAFRVVRNYYADAWERGYGMLLAIV